MRRGGTVLRAALCLCVVALALPVLWPASASASPMTITVNQEKDESLTEDPEACEQAETPTPASEKCTVREALEEIRGIIQSGAEYMRVVLPPGKFQVDHLKGPLILDVEHSACGGGAEYCDTTIVGASPSSTFIEGGFSAQLMKDVSPHNSFQRIEGLTMQDGAAEKGGAMDMASESDLEMYDVAFKHNQATVEGGALWLHGNSQVKLGRSYYVANTAGSRGGAIAESMPEFEVNGASFEENRAPQGAALYTTQTAFLNDDTIYANVAHEGSAIYSLGAVFLAYSTVTDNTIEGPNGAALQGGIRFALEDSIVAGNSSLQCGGGAYLQIPGPDIVFGPSGCAYSGQQPINADPKLGAPVLGALGTTFALEHGSPALNRDATCMIHPYFGKDQRGVMRPQGPGCDLGAVESASDAGVTLSGSPEPVTAGSALTLTAIAHAGAEPVTGVAVTVAVPSGTSFISGSPGCSPQGSNVVCTVGALAAGESRAVQVQVRGERVGGLLETATVAIAEADPEPANDTATAVGAVAVAIAGGPGGKGGAGAVHSTLQGKTFSVDAHGNLSVHISCAAGSAGGCKDTLSLYSASGSLPASSAAVRSHKAVLIAKAHVTVAAGKTAVVKLHLSSSARRRLGHRGTLSTRLVLAAASTTGAATAGTPTTHTYAVTLRRATHRR